MELDFVVIVDIFLSAIHIYKRAKSLGAARPGDCIQVRLSETNIAELQCCR